MLPKNCSRHGRERKIHGFRSSYTTGNLDKEVNVQPRLPPAFSAAAAADKVRGELENIEASIPDVRVVADDVPEVTVPQVLQLAVREGVGIGGAGVGSGTTGNATVGSWVVGEEEPVSKLEGLELPTNEAAKGGTNIGPRKLLLK